MDSTKTVPLAIGQLRQAVGRRACENVGAAFGECDDRRMFATADSCQAGIGLTQGCTAVGRPGTYTAPIT